MKKSVLITRRTHPIGVSLIEAEAVVRTLLNPGRADLRQALPGVHGIIAGISVMFDGDMLDSAPDLLVLARHGVGMDNVDLPAATERGICVLYTPQAMITAVAEHAVGLMFAVAKSFKKGDLALREGKYHTRDLLGSVDLYGKTLGVVGCGRIGSRVARMCRNGLGMNVLTYDPYVSDEQIANAGASRAASLDEMLQASDVVTIHVPLNDETRHMIGRGQLSIMKSSAYLINTARGPVIDEQALIGALQAQKIAGAAMDVFEPEPPVADNPLFSLPNVIATPHSAGSSLECLQRIAVAVSRGILDVFSGRQPDGEALANPEVWERRRPLP